MPEPGTGMNPEEISPDSSPATESEDPLEVGEDTMNNNETIRMVVVELSEHEASRLIALIKRELSQSDKTWQPYWERQMQNIQQSMERATALRRSSQPKAFS